MIMVVNSNNVLCQVYIKYERDSIVFSLPTGLRGISSHYLVDLFGGGPTRTDCTSE